MWTRARAIRWPATHVGIVAFSTLVGAQSQTPFRTAVEVVEVDVQVLDRTGVPVTSLSQKDFELEVDGRPRDLLNAELVLYANRDAAAPRATSRVSAEVPNAQVSNVAASQGRLYVIVLDTANIGRGNGKGAFEAAARFIDRLSPTDKVAVATLPAGPAAEFTSDRNEVLATIRKSVGSAVDTIPESFYTNLSLTEAYAAVNNSRPDLWSTAQNSECRARPDHPEEREVCLQRLAVEARRMVESVTAGSRASLLAFEGLLTRLAKLHGPKFVVYVGEGLVTGTSLGSLDSLLDMRNLGRLVHAARVSMYVLQYGNQFLNAVDVTRPQASRTTLDDMRLREEGLGELAGVTGGTLFKLTNNADPAFDRLVRETSAIWMLRFASTARERDGRPHSIRVRVKRPSIEVRSRRQFVSTRDARGDAPPALSQLTAVMRSPIPVRGVPLELASYVMAEPGSADMRLIVAAHVDCGPDTAQPVDVLLGVSNSKQHTVYLPVDTVTTAVSNGSGQQCLYYTARLPVPPDTYTVRLAAMDASGRTGSVDQAIDARFAGDGPLRSSSLLTTDPAVRIDGRMRVLVDGTISRGTVAAYIDLSATGRLSPSLPVVTFTLQTAGSERRQISRVSATVTADPTSAGRWYAEGLLDLPVQPGIRYLVQAVVEHEGGREVLATGQVQAPPLPAVVSRFVKPNP